MEDVLSSGCSEASLHLVVCIFTSCSCHSSDTAKQLRFLVDLNIDGEILCLDIFVVTAMVEASTVRTY